MRYREYKSNIERRDRVSKRKVSERDNGWVAVCFTISCILKERFHFVYELMEAFYDSIKSIHFVWFG